MWSRNSGSGRGEAVAPRGGFPRPVLIPVLILLAILFSVAPSPARSMFEHIGTADGLSNNTVTSIVQDRKGFLWLGTLEGLNRYDGYAFTHFKIDLTDTTSIGSNRIIALFEDRSGLLWIGTDDRGLDCFDPSTGRFRHFRHNPDDPGSLSNNQVQSILEDRSGTLWIGTVNGLNRYDRKTGSFRRYFHDRNDPSSLGNNFVGALFQDSEGTLWVGSVLRLDRYVPQSDSFVRFQPEKDTLPIDGTLIGSIAEDDRGYLWIASWGNGLWRFDRKTGRFTVFLHIPGDPRSLRSNQVGHLCRDTNGDLWVGTMGGLSLLRNGSDGFIHFANDPGDNSTISADGIWGIAMDRSGTLWAGTLRGGLNKLVRPRKVFAHYFHARGNPKSLSDNTVRAFYEDPEGFIWIGTANGMNRFDRKTGEFTVFHHRPGDPRSLSDDFISSIGDDPDGLLWIGTGGGGINRFDRKKGVVRTYRSNEPDSTGLISDWIYRVMKDDRGGYWIGTHHGLARFDPLTGRFSRFPALNDGLPFNIVNDILQDRARRIWIGSSNGLFRYDRERNEFIRYPASLTDSTKLSNAQVSSLHEDTRGCIWIGTALGVNRLDPSTGRFTRYTRRDGMANDGIYGISEDQRGNIWVIMNQGMCKIDPASGKIVNYDRTTGLPFSDFMDKSIFRARDGSIFAGGTEGFMVFHPDSLNAGGFAPPVAITSFKVFNRDFDTGRPVSETRRITLTHRDNFISFEFAALDYTAPRSNRYAYRMEGFDRDWIHSGSRRYASYTNLDPGRYTFRVKAAGWTGVWNEEGAAVEVIVLPPWWGTWWFRAGALILLMGGALLVHLLRVRAITLHRRRLEELVTERTRDLERSEALYRGLVDTSPDAILIADLDGRIQVANPRASEILGGKSGEPLVDRSLSEFLDPDDQNRFPSLMMNLRETGSLRNISLAIGRTGGDPLPVELNAILILFGEQARCMGVFRDISERKRAEEERIERERMRGIIETAGGACHELNQPLQAIMGYSDLALLAQTENARVREFMALIRKETDRMRAITRQLNSITTYHTKPYAGGIRIIDLDRAAGDGARPEKEPPA